jgi:outer membrane protein OmpA-like peptidoglycan-associated protein
MRRFIVTLPVLALALGGASACATKGFVKNRVGEVNDKVETLSKSVEENQERTRQNEAKIAQVDQKADAAQQSATSAGQSAADARNAATTANTRAESVGRDLVTMDKANKRLIYEVVLTEDQANFKFGATKLPDEAKAEIDKVVEQLKADPKGYYIEIEGHTDNVGTKMTNERIGLQRAEEVKRYLYEQHQVPLHKINVISYGEDKPVSPNNTRDGRAHNRRVVIKVLA